MLKDAICLGYFLLCNQTRLEWVFLKTNFMITLIIYIRTTDTQRDWMIFHFEEERDTVCVQNVWTITDNFFLSKWNILHNNIKKLCFFFNYINHYQNWNVEIKHIAYVSKLKSFTPLKKKWNTFLKHPLKKKISTWIMTLLIIYPGYQTGIR